VITVRYQSLADKATRYVNETLPAIFAAAEDGPNFGNGAGTLALFRLIERVRNLEQLHAAIRGGRYVDETGPKDDVQDLADTLANGGDCEDWAAVLVAACRLLGIRCCVTTSGQAWDNFLHVYVTAQDRDGAWYVLDPKGSGLGADFNKHSENYPIRRHWQLIARAVSEVAI